MNRRPQISSLSHIRANLIMQETHTWVLPEDDGPTSSVTCLSCKPPSRRESILVQRQFIIQLSGYIHIIWNYISVAEVTYRILLIEYACSVEHPLITPNHLSKVYVETL